MIAIRFGLSNSGNSSEKMQCGNVVNVPFWWKIMLDVHGQRFIQHVTASLKLPRQNQQKCHHQFWSFLYHIIKNEVKYILYVGLRFALPALPGWIQFDLGWCRRSGQYIWFYHKPWCFSWSGKVICCCEWPWMENSAENSQWLK